MIGTRGFAALYVFAATLLLTLITRPVHGADERNRFRDNTRLAPFNQLWNRASQTRGVPRRKQGSCFGTQGAKLFAEATDRFVILRSLLLNLSGSAVVIPRGAWSTRLDTHPMIIYRAETMARIEERGKTKFVPSRIELGLEVKANPPGAPRTSGMAARRGAVTPRLYLQLLGRANDRWFGDIASWPLPAASYKKSPQAWKTLEKEVAVALPVLMGSPKGLLPKIDVDVSTTDWSNAMIELVSAGPDALDEFFRGRQRHPSPALAIASVEAQLVAAIKRSLAWQDTLAEALVTLGPKAPKDTPFCQIDFIERASPGRRFARVLQFTSPRHLVTRTLQPSQPNKPARAELLIPLPKQPPRHGKEASYHPWREALGHLFSEDPELAWPFAAVAIDLAHNLDASRGW